MLPLKRTTRSMTQNSQSSDRTTATAIPSGSEDADSTFSVVTSKRSRKSPHNSHSQASSVSHLQNKDNGQNQHQYNTRHSTKKRSGQQHVRKSFEEQTSSKTRTASPQKSSTKASSPSPSSPSSTSSTEFNIRQPLYRDGNSTAHSHETASNGSRSFRFSGSGSLVGSETYSQVTAFGRNRGTPSSTGSSIGTQDEDGSVQSDISGDASSEWNPLESDSVPLGPPRQPVFPLSNMGNELTLAHEAFSSVHQEVFVPVAVVFDHKASSQPVWSHEALDIVEGACLHMYVHDVKRRSKVKLRLGLQEEIGLNVYKSWLRTHGMSRERCSNLGMRVITDAHLAALRASDASGRRTYDNILSSFIKSYYFYHIIPPAPRRRSSQSSRAPRGLTPIQAAQNQELSQRHSRTLARRMAYISEEAVHNIRQIPLTASVAASREGEVRGASSSSAADRVGGPGSTEQGSNRAVGNRSTAAASASDGVAAGGAARTAVSYTLESLSMATAYQPHWAAVQAFQIDLLGKHIVTTLKRVRYRDRPKYTALLRAVIGLVLDTPNNSPYKDLAYRLLHVFSAMMLHRNHGTVETENRSLGKRMDMFVNFEWDKLLNGLKTDLQAAAIKPSRPRGHGSGRTDPRQAKAEMLIRDGQCRKATQVFTDASTPAEPSPAAFQALADKHVPAPAGRQAPVITAAAELAAFTFAEEDVRKAIMSAPRNTQPGPCGLRFEHLRDSLPLGGDGFLQDVTQLLNLLTAETGAPPWFDEAISSARLIALNKVDGGGVRPIAMGGTLAKLVSRGLQRFHQPQFDQHFAPYQYGVGQKRGCETILHFVRESLLANPGWVCLKVDFRNAFNSVSRQAVLDAVLEHFPQLYLWVARRYGKNSKLWARAQTVGECEYILSEEGVQQGDPLAPFLFALVLHHRLLLPVNALIQAMGPGAAVGYLDDVKIIGPPDAVKAAFDFICAEGSAYGLHVNKDKCGLFCNGLRPMDLRQFPASLPQHERSMAMLGSMIGDAAEVGMFLEEKLRIMTTEIERLLQFNNPQMLQILLRICICQKFNYLLRLVSPDIRLPENKIYAEEIDKLLRYTFNEFLRVDHFPGISDKAWDQVRSPLRSGGMGFLHAPIVHHAAHLASIIECSKDVLMLYTTATAALAPEEVVPLKMEDEGRRQYDVVRTKFPPQNQTIADMFPPYDFMRETTKVDLQSCLSAAIQAQHFTNVITALDNIDVVRQFSCSAEGASYFMAIPSIPALSVSPQEHLDIVCINLNLPLSFMGMAEECPCGRGVNDREGRHLQQSCLRQGNRRNVIHSTWMDVWIEILRRAGFLCTRESGNILRITNTLTQEKTDITIHNWPNVIAHEFDVSIVDPRTHTNAAPVPGGAAEAMEKRKNDHYKTAVQNAGGIFTPLVAENFGRFGKQAREFFNKVVRAISLQTKQSLSSVASHWRQRLVVALKRANIQQMRIAASNQHRVRNEQEEEQEQEEIILENDYVDILELHRDPGDFDCSE